MINATTKQRELAYVVKIDKIEPIVGSDNCEAAVVGGWRIMVRKNTFKEGDLAVYFEIDSKVPETETFKFLEKKHYRIKTQKYTFGGKNPGFYSQGLLMAFEDFGWAAAAYSEGDFLTEKLGVTYAIEEDNKRKGASPDKYKKMAARHPKLFKNPIIKKIYKTKIGKKILFLFFGKKRDKTKWPDWVVKTDEERVQNLPHIVEDKGPWIVTEKVDGTSTSFTTRRGRFNKKDFYVCSRNVCFTKERGDKCFYSENYYTKMAQKYNIETVLSMLLDDNPEAEWVVLQGETYGEGVQKRNYHMREQNFMAFNLIFSNTGRLNSCEMAALLLKYGIPSVPIVRENYMLPDTIEEILEYAGSEESQIDGGMREGLVFRYYDGTKSFKAVDNAYLVKYHQ